MGDYRAPYSHSGFVPQDRQQQSGYGPQQYSDQQGYDPRQEGNFYPSQQGPGYNQGYHSQPARGRGYGRQWQEPGRGGRHNNWQDKRRTDKSRDTSDTRQEQIKQDHPPVQTKQSKQLAASLQNLIADEEGLKKLAGAIYNNLPAAQKSEFAPTDPELDPRLAQVQREIADKEEAKRAKKDQSQRGGDQGSAPKTGNNNRQKEKNPALVSYTVGPNSSFSPAVGTGPLITMDAAIVQLSVDKELASCLGVEAGSRFSGPRATRKVSSLPPGESVSYDLCLDGYNDTRFSVTFISAPIPSNIRPMEYSFPDSHIVFAEDKQTARVTAFAALSAHLQDQCPTDSEFIWSTRMTEDLFVTFWLAFICVLQQSRSCALFSPVVFQADNTYVVRLTVPHDLKSVPLSMMRNMKWKNFSMPPNGAYGLTFTDLIWAVVQVSTSKLAVLCHADMKLSYTAVSAENLVEAEGKRYSIDSDFIAWTLFKIRKERAVPYGYFPVIDPRVTKVSLYGGDRSVLWKHVDKKYYLDGGRLLTAAPAAPASPPASDPWAEGDTI